MGKFVGKFHNDRNYSTDEFNDGSFASDFLNKKQKKNQDRQLRDVRKMKKEDISDIFEENT